MDNQGKNKDTDALRQLFSAWMLSRWSLTALSVLSVLTIILLIWKVPQWQAEGIKDNKERPTFENAARGTFVQTVSGLFFFITAYFSWRNLVATEDKQVTERFAKAIELLCNTSIHVRLGAIYALERIAEDSDKDYWQVMEILTAYVRELSPYPPREQKADNTPFWASALSIHQKNNQPTVKDIPAITTDIQAVLTVIGRRTKSYKHGEENRLDLSKSNLAGANLREADLSGVNLIEAYLSGANLREANLREAYLSGANLYGANLYGANLSGANLREANLSDAYLDGAGLPKAQYTDNSTSAETCKRFTEKYPCPTHFPPNFDPKAAGMELVK